MLFTDLRLVEPILRSLSDLKYQTATPIQAAAIPPALEGRDVLGSAQTGTGKTAAFALPVLQRLASVPRGDRRIRCLVLCPTRELAVQINDGFRDYGSHLRVTTALVFGGVNQGPQVQAMRRGVDVAIATPGRFLDLMRQGHVDLRGVETLVLDEADRMLDMGFINDIRTIVQQLPKTRQTLLFSATMPNEIRKLADSLLRDPARIDIAPKKVEAALIDESVYMVDKRDKSAALAHLIDDLPMTRAIVFTRTKHGADKVVKSLVKRGIAAEAIHGNKSQNARQRALERFRIGRIPVLVATDIASRGIDVDNVTHVVNYDLTHEPETYVHRIGRTGRAGATGFAVSLVDRDEMGNLRAIERLIRRKVTVKTGLPDFGSTREVVVAPERPARPERHSTHTTRDLPERKARPFDRHADRIQRSTQRPQEPRHAPRGSDRPAHVGASTASHRPARPQAHAPAHGARSLHPVKRKAKPAHRHR
jgi:ATP-dependent RNA helicase RhlE